MSLVTVRAPGKMFISGEYSILFGYPALLLAVDKYIYVTIGGADGYRYGEGNKEHINAHSYEEFLRRIKRRSIHIYAAIKTIHDELGIRVRNIYIHTRSTIPFKGLGSSAATLVATIYALNQYLGLELDKEGILDLSYRAKRMIEGGSIADIATSLYGGVVYVRQGENQAPVVEKIGTIKIMDRYRLEAVYTGERIATKNVVRSIMNSINESTYKRKIIDLIGETTRRLRTILKKGEDEEQFLRLFRLNHHLLAALGVSTPKIDGIVHEIESKGGYAKISGAGFGDSLLTIWVDKREELEKAVDRTPLKIDQEGAHEVTDKYHGGGGGI